MDNTIQTKRSYRLADNIHKLLHNKWTYISFISFFFVATVVQMILFGFDLQPYNGIHVGTDRAWSAWMSLTITFMGTSLGMVGASKSARRRKDFFWWTFIAFICYSVNSMVTGIYLDATKTMIMAGIFVYQKFNWDKAKTDHIQPRSLNMKYVLGLIAFATIAGTTLGWAIYGASWTTYVVDWLSYLDGIAMFMGLIAMWMIANKYKEGYIVSLINMAFVIIIFSIVGSPVAIVNTMFVALVNVYAAISWHKHINDNIE